MIKHIVLGTLIAAFAVSGLQAESVKNLNYSAKPAFASDWALMAKELRLTNKQDAQIKKINKAYDKKYAAYSKKISPLREKLHKEMSEKSPNFSSSRHMMEKLSAYETDLRMDQLKHRFRISKVLSNDQKTTFQTLANQYPDPDWYPDPSWYPNPEWRTAKTAAATTVTPEATVAEPAPTTSVAPAKPLTKKEAKKLAEDQKKAAENQKKLEKQQKEELERQEKLKKKEESKQKRAKIKADITKAASKEIEKLAEKQTKK